MSLKVARKCPKCNAQDIALIPGDKNINTHKIFLNMWMTTYLLKDIYICKRCGHFEEYVQMDRKSLKTIGKYQEEESLQAPHDSFDEYI